MIGNKKVVATIEVRMTSTRLPGKVIMPMAGKPALQLLVERLRRSKFVDEVVVATTTNAADDAIATMCESIGCAYHRGSENDVLARVLGAAQEHKADIIVEICGDCPLVDHRQVDKLLELMHEGGYDAVANNLDRSFPIGFDIRIFKTELLANLDRESQDPYDREHVSPHFYNNPERYKVGGLSAEGNMRRRDIRLTLDYKEDYDIISKVFEKLLPTKEDFSAEDIVALFEREPELMDINKHLSH